MQGLRDCKAGMRRPLARVRSKRQDTHHREPRCKQRRNTREAPLRWSCMHGGQHRGVGHFLRTHPEHTKGAHSVSEHTRQNPAASPALPSSAAPPPPHTPDHCHNIHHRPLPSPLSRPPFRSLPRIPEMHAGFGGALPRTSSSFPKHILPLQPFHAGPKKGWKCMMVWAVGARL